MLKSRADTSSTCSYVTE